MTRLLTGKDLRHIEIGTHLISVNAYDVGEVDDLIDAAADSIDTIYKENVRLAKKCAALEATISVLEDTISDLKADLNFTKYANLNNPVKENPNVSEENRTRLDGLFGWHFPTSRTQAGRANAAIRADGGTSQETRRTKKGETGGNQHRQRTARRTCLPTNPRLLAGFHGRA